MKNTIVAAVAGAALLFTATAASAQVCVLGIFIAAAQVSASENRELTSKEALSCGLSRLFEDKDKAADKDKANKDKKAKKQTPRQAKAGKEKKS